MENNCLCAECRKKSQKIMELHKKLTHADHWRGVYKRLFMGSALDPKEEKPQLQLVSSK